MLTDNWKYNSLEIGHYQNLFAVLKDRQAPVPSNKAQAWQRAI